MRRVIVIVFCLLLIVSSAPVGGQTMFTKRVMFIAQDASPNSQLAINLASILVNNSPFEVPPDLSAEKAMIQQGTKLSTTNGGPNNRFMVDIAVTEVQYTGFIMALQTAQGNPFYIGYNNGTRPYVVAASSNPALIGFEFIVPIQVAQQAGYFAFDEG